MISYVLNMISYVMLHYDIICTFRMKNINKSYMISYVFDFSYDVRCIYNLTSYVISPVSSCRRLAGPVQKRPLSCSNAPLFESNAAAARPLRLSLLFGSEITLHCCSGL